ncbi:acyltransferase, partial [Klebsiella pneumoniae]
HFVPIPTEVKGPLLLVQANFFQCGGIALGVRISHKLADAATFTTLITGWANIARGFCDAVSLDFSAATLFPPRDDLCPVHPIALDNLDRIIQNCITRRYVFDGSKVAALKSKSTSESVTQPSRVEAVTALLWSVIAASKSRLASQRSSSLIWAANLRPRLMPPLPEQSFGNLSFPMLLHANEGETDLSCFVCHLKRGIAELRDNFGKTLDEEEKLS